MKLDVYRSCSFSEKREVLGTFWRGQAPASEKIAHGAEQYGPWALLALIVIALELVALLVFVVVHGHPAGWFLLLPGLLVGWGIWISLTRMSLHH